LGIAQEHPVTVSSQGPLPLTVGIGIVTPLGDIAVKLFVEQAAVTAENFLRYVEQGLYDGGRFHRTVTLDNQSNTNLGKDTIGAGIDADRAQLPNDTVAIEVIQGGIHPDRQDALGAAIPLERTRDTGLRHVEGTISMARLTPDSAVSDFFICINDQPELDFGGRRNPDGQGFAAFGQVTSGMDVVRAIQRSPAHGQSLDPPIEIIRITRYP
jgi:peptidyl-prolyl cis-trans isomerase A (cyclophilin A)